MGKCKTCKYWKLGEPYCSPNKEEWGNCEHPKVKYADYLRDDDALLLYADYEGFGAGIGVHEEFGCILHEHQASEGDK